MTLYLDAGSALTAIGKAKAVNKIKVLIIYALKNRVLSLYARSTIN